MDNVRYLEFNGGLGDILYAMYDNNKYLSLETLQPGERAVIGVISSNPSVKELFLWHPKVSQMEIREVEHQHPWGPEQRRAVGLPEVETSQSGVGGLPVSYYPPQEDLDLIRNYCSKPYIVFSLTAGLPYRDVPLEVAKLAARTALEMGFTPILVGRNFQIKRNNPRFEMHLGPEYGAIDLIDRLTIPGTARLIEMADGVFCHEGAVMHLTWRLKKPCFVVPSHKQDHWKFGQWLCWGVNQPKTSWSFDNTFTKEKLVDWIETKVVR